jgi:hypothetical protein
VGFTHQDGRIVAGELVHIDETEVKLRKSKGYVWVLTSMALEKLVNIHLTRALDFA